MNREADVTINGTDLSFPQAMSLRVAVSSFRMAIADPSTRKELGPVADGYDCHLQTIERLLLNLK